jgi:hypothetical protein
VKPLLLLLALCAGCTTVNLTPDRRQPMEPEDMPCQPSFDDPNNPNAYSLECPGERAGVRVKRWAGLSAGSPDRRRPVACLLPGRTAVLWVASERACVAAARRVQEHRP